MSDTDTPLAHAAEVARLTADLARARSILALCVSAIGNGSAALPECSLDFFSHVPEGIRSAIEKLTKERDEARKQTIAVELAITKEATEDVIALSEDRRRLKVDVERLMAERDNAREREKVFAEAHKKRNAEVARLTAELAIRDEQLAKHAHVVAVLAGERDELRAMHSQMCAASTEHQRERDSERAARIQAQAEAATMRSWLKKVAQHLETANELLAEEGVVDEDESEEVRQFVVGDALALADTASPFLALLDAAERVLDGDSIALHPNGAGSHNCVFCLRETMHTDPDEQHGDQCPWPRFRAAVAAIRGGASK